MPRFHVVCAILFPALLTPAALAAQLPGTAPPPVPDSAWVSLLDGGAVDRWTPKIRGEMAGEDARGTFRVADGVLQVRYDGYDTFEERFGHLFFDTSYSHYRLELEYRFVPGRLPDTPEWARMNSGVMVHAQDPASMPQGQDFPISLEAQFLGELEPGTQRPTMNLCTPGTHVVYGGRLEERHCIESTSATYPAGDWVRVELVVLGDSLVQHLVEGEVVLEYGGPVVGGGVVNDFDPEAKLDGTPLGSGFIALQSEGQPLDVRNVRLVELKGCMEVGDPAFRPWYVEPDPAKCSG